LEITHLHRAGNKEEGLQIQKDENFTGDIYKCSVCVLGEGEKRKKYIKKNSVQGLN
jgi:hypothetical protein